ncbi:ABC transporter ATP-binding protein [uncultured Ruminococcus sp.]|uniref:ABC transporter ATP-binding protein n=1 Tax=uncultured Ruminococcus sp. TaxID=165186 RepID=UPI00261EF5F2|nr:energy-coupling factor ABC transporter ATP-binding protein [uncultured Ruminococcus sp.]
MIEFRNVTFAYSSTDANGRAIEQGSINGLDLTIQNGEFIVLTGGSGCGKTTVTRLINGLIPHYYSGTLNGEVMIDGKSVPDTPIFETAKKVGSVFQNPRSQFFNVNTTDEIAFAAENQCCEPAEISKAITATAASMHIEKLLDRNIFELSGGEKQIIACAGINVLSPDIIVLDEPSSNLDSEAIEKLKAVLTDWKSQGKTIVIAEHRLYFLRELADRMLILENGRIAKELITEEIKKLTADDTEKMGIRPTMLPEIHCSQKNTDVQGDVLLLEDFRFTYNDGKHGINIPRLELPANHIIAIIGHNGAGKSTLARNICGLERKCKGTLIMNGKKLKAKDRLHSCYMIMQDVNHQLFTESVRDEVMLSMTDKLLTDEQKIKKADEILSQLDLLEYANTHPMALSGGQKQRTAIASGVASSKPVIIFDEPTSGLDLAHMKQVSNQLKKLKEIGKTIIVVTHDNEFILSCCDHIVRLENGCVADN